ncbi:MAG: hypothetical protein IPM30_14960 [Burkholderiales bacterium]|nr:hypothetical protein [Burkholderiales bacterium]
MPTEIEPERLVDLRPSCTRDEAIAKLLGWRRGPLVPKYFDVNIDGVRVDQIPLLLSTEMPLHEQLAAIREAARRDLLTAAEGDVAPGELDEKESALAVVDELIKKARTYSVHIEDEFAKGADSALRIDAAATSESGEEHITLASLDRWARERYAGLSIFEDSTSAHSVELGSRPDEPPTAEGRAASVPAPADAGPDRTAANADAPIIVIKTKSAWRCDRVDHFLATFAFVVEALAEKSASRYMDDKGQLKIDPLAQDLAKRAKQAANIKEDNKFLKGLSPDSIKSRIEDALGAKREQLPTK